MHVHIDSMPQVFIVPLSFSYDYIHDSERVDWIGDCAYILLYIVPVRGKKDKYPDGVGIAKKGLIALSIQDPEKHPHIKYNFIANSSGQWCVRVEIDRDSIDYKIIRGHVTQDDGEVDMIIQIENSQTSERAKKWCKRHKSLMYKHKTPIELLCPL